MSSSDIINGVERWLAGHPDFQLITADETANQLYFSCDARGVSRFAIKYPISPEERWDVETELDSVGGFLAETREFCRGSKNISVVDILEHINKKKETLVDEDFDYDDEDMDDDNDMAMGLDDDADEWIEANQNSAPSNSSQDDQLLTRFKDAGFQGSNMSTHRLISDMQAMHKSLGKFGFTCNPRDDNLYIWDVQLIDFGTDTLLAKDLVEYAKKFKREPVVNLEMRFQDDYPMSPPFIRVLRPKFRFLTGHVTIGGSICLQLLTRSGWSSANDIESILVQIRSEILSDPNCRLDLSSDVGYSEQEAKEAFDRMVLKYGWNK